MKKHLLLLFLSSLYISFVFTQTNLSGIINRYASVTAIDTCAAALSVDDPSGFTAGTDILLIQMQGATISNANNNTFGNITALNNAGLYERAVIESVNGNKISLRNALLNSYQTTGAVQIVSIPIYENAVVTDTLHTKPWNGKTGGVLALEVKNTLRLNAPIEASGKGFRGGEANITTTNNCNALINATDYFYGLNNWRGATKGEGIAAIQAGKEAGRGAQANGGGGGNDHNSGGGGGGNTTGGGNGGRNEEPDIFGCDGPNPGLGGKAIFFSDNRIFLGGGGGAGHENNQVGTDGGNGGGIILLIAKNVVGNNQKIAANGVTPDTTIGEGGGGGGAGGTIILQVAQMVSSFSVEVRGGSGGAINNNNQQRCHGPGGGGAGGRIIGNAALQFSYAISRGDAGRSFNSRSCGTGTNGGQNGSDGILEPFKNIPKSDQFKGAPAIAGQPRQVPVCANKPFNIEVAVNGSNLKYQWQLDKSDGAGFQNLTDNNFYTGTQTTNLKVSNLLPAMSTYKFRLQISSPCATSINSEPISLILQAVPTVQFNFTNTATRVTFSNTSTNADEYFWDFGDGSTSDQANPSHTYAQSGDYTVTLSAINRCDSTVIRKIVSLLNAPTANFSANVTLGCQPLNVTFQNTSSANSSNFTWILPGATPSTSTEKNPTVVYNNAGKFAAILIAANAAGIDTIRFDSFVVVKPKPTPSFTTIASELSVLFSNTSSNATSYNWDFGDGKTSTAPNPTHIYEKPGRYSVTLTLTNDCGAQSITQQVRVSIPLTARFTAVRPNGCAPHTVNFTDVSNGTYESRFWEFPGGNPATSTEANPRVVYSTPGEYDVRLIIKSDSDSDTIKNIAFVKVLFSPTPAFTFRNNGNTVTFNNESVSATSYQWNFGDEQTSTQPNPVYTYANNGVYTVTLNASNAYCGRSLSRTITVGLNAIEDLQASGIWVFPNPTQDQLFVNAETIVENLALKLYSLEGKLLVNQLFTKQITVAMSAFAKGSYLLQLQKQDKIWITKIVKN